MRFFCLIFLFVILGRSADLSAECISLIRGQIGLDVLTCGRLSPEQTFETTESRFQFIKDFPPKERKEFLDTYRGLVVSGHIARSFATRSGLGEQQGALHGQKRVFFFPPGVGTCQEIQGKRLKANLEEACCEGGGDPPCLLQTTLVVEGFTVLGKAGTHGSKKGKNIQSVDIYEKADTFYGKKEFANAARYYEKVRLTEELDVRGHYKLGHSYRELDKCKRGIPILKKLYELDKSKQFWTNDEKVVRMGTFMLARCYSKINKPGFAVQVLSGYLQDPQKYRPELLKSLKHPDFGWIRTTKEYRTLKKQILRALRSKGN